jgi:hypothetical protein
VIALRHLRTNRTLTFAAPGTFTKPMIPAGMTESQLHKIYLSCAQEGLVIKREKYGSGERTFEIAPTMEVPLENLLYE